MSAVAFCKRLEREEKGFRSLTTFNLHGALLRVVRVQMEIHGAGQDQRQPGRQTDEHASLYEKGSTAAGGRADCVN